MNKQGITIQDIFPFFQKGITAYGVENTFSDDFEGTLAKWTDGGATLWDISTVQEHAGVQSVETVNGQGEGDIFTDDIDTANATLINVSFWFRDDDLDANDIDFYFFDGTAYDAVIDAFEEGTEDTWQYVEFTTTDSQYFISNFRVRFNSVLGTGEAFWLDDFLVQVTTADAPENCWTYNAGSKLLIIPSGCIYEQSSGTIGGV